MRSVGLALLLVTLAAPAVGAQTLPPGFTPPEGPRQLVSSVFEVKFSATGTYTLINKGPGAGESRVDGQPRWAISYKQIAFPFNPKAGDETHANPDAYPGGGEYGAWQQSGTVSDFDPNHEGPDPFTCSGNLTLGLTSETVSHPTARVRGAGDGFDLELPSVSAIAARDGSCNPAIAGGYNAWGGDLGTRATAFLHVSSKDIDTRNAIRLPADALQTNKGKLGVCRTPGTCTHELLWHGDVTLTKVCRNYAGIDSEFSSAPGGAGAVRCESTCEADGCSREDVELKIRAPIKATSRGRVGVPIACFGDSTCRGTVKMTASGGRAARAAKTISYGSSSFKVAPGASRRATLRLSAGARALLRRTHVLSGRVTVALTGSAVKTPRSTTIVVRR